jgi:hypothetical protein
LWTKESRRKSAWPVAAGSLSGVPPRGDNMEVENKRHLVYPFPPKKSRGTRSLRKQKELNYLLKCEFAVCLKHRGLKFYKV